MPIHFEDLDVVAEAKGIRSALIVPCNVCPAVTVAVREKKPFLKLFRNFLKSAPFEQYIRELQSRLKEKGVTTKVFRSPMPYQWFLCMWTNGRSKKLKKEAQKYDAVIVLGCDSADKTVRDLVESASCKVIPGMEVGGIMNAKLRFSFSGHVFFENCKIVPISDQKKEDATLINKK